MAKHEDFEDLPDLSDWRMVESWTLEEAAKIWAGIDPREYRDQITSLLSSDLPRQRVYKAETALRAFTDAVCDGTLPYDEAWIYAPQGWNDEVVTLEHKDRSTLPRRTNLDVEMTRVRYAALTSWCEKRGFLSAKQERNRAKQTAKTAVMPPAPVLELAAPLLKGKTIETAYRAVAEFPKHFPNYRNKPPMMKQINAYVGEIFGKKADSREALIFGRVVAENLDISSD